MLRPQTAATLPFALGSLSASRAHSGDQNAVFYFSTVFSPFRGSCDGTSPSGPRRTHLAQGEPAQALQSHRGAGVVAQRLARKACQDCNREYEPPDWVKDAVQGDSTFAFREGAGCDQCHQSGYRGRTAIHELLSVDDEMRKLITQEADIKELTRQAVESGMIPMREDGLVKAKAGITTVEEVLRVT